jgi:tetratricopeptide (TPR) repeat protein
MNKMLIVLLVFVIAVAAISCGGLVHDHKWVFHNSSSYTVEIHNRALLDKWRDWKDFSLKPGKRKTVWSSRRVEWRHYPDSKVRYVEKTKSGGYGYNFEMYGAVVFGDRGETNDANSKKKSLTTAEARDIYLSRCRSWYDKGDYDKAIDECTRSLWLDQNYAMGWYTRARVHARKGEHYRALHDLKEAITLDKSLKTTAKKDEVFKALWDNEKFKQLIE